MFGWWRSAASLSTRGVSSVKMTSELFLRSLLRPKINKPSFNRLLIRKEKQQSKGDLRSKLTTQSAFRRGEVG